jgi:hypothetical protein
MPDCTKLATFVSVTSSEPTTPIRVRLSVAMVADVVLS